MPQGDRFRSIQIGVDLIAAIAALEIRLIRTDTQMQTSRTGLRRVPRVDIYDLHSLPGRLVADHLLKFGKTPFVNAFRLAGLTNPVEVFQDDPLIIRFRVSHDLFTDAVIGVRDEPPLTAGDTRKRPFGALAAVGLERSSRPFVAGFLVANILRRVELPVRCHCHPVEAEIDAEAALWLFNLRLRDRDRNVQVEVPLAIDQFGRAEFALLKLSAHPGGHLQPAGDAAFRTDDQRDGLTVRTKSHRLGVISQGRMRFELMPLIRVARVNGADLGNRVDHVLRGKIRFFSDQAISRVMDVVSAMQILLKGEFGKGVAGAIELFHSGFEFLAVASCQDQFSLYRQVNIHPANMPQVFYLRQVFYMRKGRRIPLHRKRSVYGWSILRKER